MNLFLSTPVFSLGAHQLRLIHQTHRYNPYFESSFIFLFSFFCGHPLQSPSLCYLFLQLINLKGKKYLLKGQINVASSSSDGPHELLENLIVDILNSEGSVIDGTTAGLASTGNEQTSYSVYEFSVWAKLGEKLTFVPRDARYIVGCL